MIQLIITIIIVGFLLWLVNRYIPMEPIIKSILIAVVVLALVLYILHYFGVYSL